MAAKKSGSKSKKRKGGLPAKYIRANGGNMKKAWAEYHRVHDKKSKKRKSGSKKGVARKGKKRGKVTVSVKKPGRKTAKVTLAAERKKGGKKGGGKKKRKHSMRSPESIASAIVRDKTRLANLKGEFEAKMANYRRRLEHAEGSERERLNKQIANLKSKLVEAESAHARREAQYKAKLEAAKVEWLAAEKRRRGRKKNGKHAKRNPLPNPITGLGESLAAVGGALTAILATVVPYRMLRSHALTPVNAGQGGAAGTYLDQPAQGDVPNLASGQLPVWSRMKWRGLIAIGTFLVLDVAVPFTVAGLVGSEHGKTKTFFEVWGITATTLGGAKLVVDVAAVATKKTKFGQRAFAPENVARSLRAASAQQQLPAISVASGLGLPGLTGYGQAQPPQQVGAGCAKCGNAQVATGGCGCTKAAQPAAPQPQAPPAATHGAPTAPTPPRTVGTPDERVGTQGAHVGAAIEMSNVTPIKRSGPTPMRRAFGRR